MSPLCCRRVAVSPRRDSSNQREKADAPPSPENGETASSTPGKRESESPFTIYNTVMATRITPTRPPATQKTRLPDVGIFKIGCSVSYAARHAMESAGRSGRNQLAACVSHGDQNRLNPTLRHSENAPAERRNFLKTGCPVFRAKSKPRKSRRAGAGDPRPTRTTHHCICPAQKGKLGGRSEKHSEKYRAIRSG